MQPRQNEKNNSQLDIPNELICPLTGQLFDNPVLLPCGTVVEKDAIIPWINKEKTNPFTRQPLTIDELKPAIEILGKKELFLKALEANKLNIPESYKPTNNLLATNSFSYEMELEEMRNLIANQSEASNQEEMKVLEGNLNLFFSQIASMIEEKEIDQPNQAPTPGNHK